MNKEIVIFMADFINKGLFKKLNLPYEDGQFITGTQADALRIAGECFSKGLNVWMNHDKNSNGNITIIVDEP